MIARLAVRKCCPPFDKLGGELLFDVISQAYEWTSVIVTPNLPFEQWPEVLGGERLTGAVLVNASRINFSP